MICTSVSFSFKRKLAVIFLLILILYFGKEELLKQKVHQKHYQHDEKYRRRTASSPPPPPTVHQNATVRAIVEVNDRCSGHYYNRGEWTLNVWDDGKEPDCKESTKVLFQANLVKTIMHKNGSTQNLGCRNDTEMCTEKPHFDKLFRVRVNTPPCCRAKLISIYKHFTNKLEQRNITYFLMFGALIGYSRDKAMVPYDSDIDMFIDSEVWDSFLVDILSDIKRQYGHNYDFHDEGNKLKLFYSTLNNNSIDVWPFSVVEDYYGRPKVRIPHYDAVDQPMANIFPLRKVFFEGVWTYIPRKTDNVLDVQYGRGNWKEELDCKVVAKNGHCMPGHTQISTPIRTSSSKTINYLLLFLFIFVVLLTSFMCLLIKCVPDNIAVNT